MIGDDLTALYRFFDADGRLLYVGISDNIRSRWGHHRNHKSWWPDVARATVELFDTWGAAAEAEDLAIKTEDPLYNVTGRPRRIIKTPDWPAQPIVDDEGQVMTDLQNAAAEYERLTADMADLKGQVMEAATSAIEAGCPRQAVYAATPFSAQYVRRWLQEIEG